MLAVKVFGPSGKTFVWARCTHQGIPPSRGQVCVVGEMDYGGKILGFGYGAAYRRGAK